MKKLLQKTIIFIVLWMILLNGIVPTRVVWATGTDPAGSGDPQPELKELGFSGLVQLLDQEPVYYGMQYGNGYRFTVTKSGNYQFGRMGVDGSMQVSIYEFDEEYGEPLGALPSTEYSYSGRSFVGQYLTAGTTYWISETGYNEAKGYSVYDLDDEASIGSWGGEEANEPGASLIERLLTILFLTIGDGAMWVIGAVVGDSISMDSLFFNDYPSTRLSFFVGQADASIQEPNPFLESGDVLTTIGNIFDAFRVVAIGIYVVMLLYMGIRILLSSTGREKSKYKDLAMYWLKGVAILYLFPYVMKYTILMNDALVNYIKTVKSKVQMEQIQIDTYPGGLSFPLEFGGISTKERTDYMSYLRKMAQDTGRLAYAICWLILIMELIKFFIIYFRRLLITLFLIAVFPLVTISYAIDKIGDGKSQAFDNWFKEFVLNVFLQTFHALNYTVIMGLVFAIGSGGETVNYILILVAITYIAKGEQILRGIFGQDKGVGTVKSAMDSIVKTATIKSLVSGTGRAIKNRKKAITSFVDRGRGISDHMMRNTEARLLEKNKTLDTRETKNDIRDNILIATSETSSPQDIRIAIQKLFQYSINPETEGEWETQRDLRSDSKELQAMRDEYEVLAEIEQNLEINLDTMLNIAVTRKGSRSLQSRKLLQAYGYTEKGLEDVYKKLVADKNTYGKLQTLNQKRIRKMQSKEDISPKPEASNIIEARVLFGDKNTKAITNVKKKYSKLKLGKSQWARTKNGYQPITEEETEKSNTQGLNFRKVQWFKTENGYQLMTEEQAEKAGAQALKLKRGKWIKAENGYQLVTADEMEDLHQGENLEDKGEEWQKTSRGTYRLNARKILGKANKKQTKIVGVEVEKQNFTGKVYHLSMKNASSKEFFSQQLRTSRSQLSEPYRASSQGNRKMSTGNTNGSYRFEAKGKSNVADYQSVSQSGYYQGAKQGKGSYEQSSKNTQKEKFTAKKLPRTTTSMRDTYEKFSMSNNERAKSKKSTKAAQQTDPLLKTYTDSNKEIVGKRRNTAEQERLKRRRDIERRREAQRKKEEKVSQMVDQAIKARREHSISSATRDRYEVAAKNVEVMANQESTFAEKVQAKQDFDDVVMQIRMAQGIQDDAGITTMQQEVPKDVRESFLHIEKMKVEAAEAHGKDLMTPDLEKTYSDLAIDVETLSRGDETLNGLWQTVDKVESVSSSYDDGIKVIQEKLGFTLEEYRTNLAVETLNHISELQGTKQEKQKIIDRAIETVKDHQYQKGLYGQILGGLQFDINQLQKGQVPVLARAVQKSATPKKTKEALKIEKALQEKRKQERGSIYYVDSSYNRKAESKKIRKEVIRLGKDIAKDTAESTASAVGGIVGAAAYMGIEDQYDVAKIAAATSLGSTTASVVESRVVDFAESAVNETSKLAKRFGKALKDNKKNGNPITMYDDKGRPIQS